MSNIIGLMCLWGSGMWAEAALKQATEYCDEVMVMVAPFKRELEVFEDETYDICKSYKGITLLDLPKEINSVLDKAYQKCSILNYMVFKSKLFKKNNWVWILDVDEYYDKPTYKIIKELTNDNRIDSIRLKERFFYINMKNFMGNNRCRLHKVPHEQCRFKPTQIWVYDKTEILIQQDYYMYHYSMLTNTKIHEARWKAIFNNNSEDYKIKWLHDIYYNYDLNNEEYWLNKNYNEIGVRTPWHNKDFNTYEDGKLVKYYGEHPEFVRKFEDIEDFRELYK